MKSARKSKETAASHRVCVLWTRCVRSNSNNPPTQTRNLSRMHGFNGKANKHIRITQRIHAHTCQQPGTTSYSVLWRSGLSENTFKNITCTGKPLHLHLRIVTVDLFSLETPGIVRLLRSSGVTPLSTGLHHSYSREQQLTLRKKARINGSIPSSCAQPVIQPRAAANDDF